MGLFLLILVRATFASASFRSSPSSPLLSSSSLSQNRTLSLPQSTSASFLPSSLPTDCVDALTSACETFVSMQQYLSASAVFREWRQISEDAAKCDAEFHGFVELRMRSSLSGESAKAFRRGCRYSRGLCERLVGNPQWRWPSDLCRMESPLGFHESCVVHGTVVDCADSEEPFMQFPLEIPTNATQIFLGGNALTSLFEDVLSRFPDLRVLDLSRNQVGEIAAASSHDPMDFPLRTLRLSRNELRLRGLNRRREMFRNFVGLENLWMDHNNLTVINKYTFRGLRSLKFLNLASNSLGPVVARAAFESTPSLESLNLSSNEFRKVGPSSFDATTRLRSLDLSRNRLTTLSPRAFAALPNLRALNLRHNHLAVLEPRALHGLRGLELLDMGRNRLRRVPIRALHAVTGLRRLFLDANVFPTVPTMAFYPLVDLVELRLNRNENLTSVRKWAFDGLFNLEKLVLSHNPRLSFVDEDLFPTGGSPKLKTVFLNDNALTNLSTRAFAGSPNLRVVDVSKNPFRCDCHLRKLKSFLDFEANRRNARRAEWKQKLLESKLECAEPPNLKGRNLSLIEFSQLTCNPPDILEEPECAAVTVVFGSDFSLRLRVSGLGRPSVQWFDSLANPVPGVAQFSADAAEFNVGGKNVRLVYQSSRSLADGEIESTLTIVGANYLSTGKYVFVARNAGGRTVRTYYVVVKTRAGMGASAMGGDSHSAWHRRRSILLMVLLTLIICFACIFQKQIHRFRYTPKRNSNN